MKWSSAINEVPFVPEARIEKDADALIAEYAQRPDVSTGPPVPVEELLEVQLGLQFEIADLRAEFESDDVLGVIWFNSKLVKIDSSLDPHERPHMLGRFRYTLAHEVGHWRLHRQFYREDPTQAKLFDGKGRPAFVCRSSEKPSVEWQADAYASCLLMPRNLLVAAWQGWRGGLDPVVLATLPPASSAGGRDPDNVRMEQFCKPLAEQFEVSAEAMRIRLERLGLLVRKMEARLF